MKKLILISLLAIAPLFVSAYDFMVNGVAYKILSMEDLEVEVAQGCIPDTDGKLVIPGTVEYKGRSFKVLGIGMKEVPLGVSETWLLDFWTLKELTIEEGPTYIGHDAFQLQSMNTIRIPKTITTICSSAFAENNGRYRNPYDIYMVYDPYNLIIEDADEMLTYNHTSFAPTPFDNSTITYLYLGRNISAKMFVPKTTKYIETLEIGDKVNELTTEELGGGTLTSLKTLIIGKGLNIVPYVAEGDKIEKVYVRTEQPQTSLGFNDGTFITATLYVPQGSKDAYMNADIWKNFWTIEEYDPATMTNINPVKTTDTKNGPIFDMNGHRIKDVSKGLYIKGGRKYIKN